MRKFLTLLCLCALWVPAVAGKAASALPDNIYFRAMQDEMTRTLKKLRSKGSPNPYYLAYKLIKSTQISWRASLGESYASANLPDTQLGALVLLGVGSDKNDQFGFDNNRYYYQPMQAQNVADSYDGIRRTLWQLTDAEYLISSDSYAKKQAYKRQKNLPDNLPDVTPAPQGTDFEALSEFPSPNAEKWMSALKELSAKGKGIAWLENFALSFSLQQEDSFYLNSLGGAYQVPFTKATVMWYAQFRNQQGYIQRVSTNLTLPNFLIPDEEVLAQKTDLFLKEIFLRYQAYKAEPYLGPILLRPAAAARFLKGNFVWQVQNVKPLLSDKYDNDASAGSFRNKKGLRVISNVVDMIEDPLARSYEGKPLVYVPIDDEGVPSQKLALTARGQLRELPLSRRPVNKGQISNGHARLSAYTYPRESLTNVFVQPKETLALEALEQKFVTLCREWDLAYCYEVDSFENQDGTLTNRAWRVYAQDGRKEPVFGLELQSLSERSLRDIVAAGGNTEVTYEGDPLRRFTVITPSLLLQEAEGVPSDAKPDKPPFVTKPN